MFFEANPAGFEEVTRAAPKGYRIPARDALGPGTDAKAVEIAKDVLPTIGLHLMRLPSGAKHEQRKTTVNHLYSVIGGAARIAVEGGMNETLAVGDVVTVPCWHKHEITADADTILLRVSDEPLLRKVGLVRHAARRAPSHAVLPRASIARDLAREAGSPGQARR